MRRHVLTFLAAAVVAAAPAPAGAQDTKPVLKEIHDAADQPITEAFPGQTIVLVGRNLHQCPPQPEGPQTAPQADCRHEELSVRLESEDMMVFNSTFDRLMVAISPFESLGQKTIRVALRGRGDASIRIKLVPRPEQATGAEGGIEGGGAGAPNSAAPDLDERIRAEFKIERFQLVRDGGTSRFEVAGTVGKIPDGMSVAVILAFDSREIEPRKIPVRSGRFDVTFGPYNKQLLVGNYSVNVLFELARQPAARLRQFLRALSDDEKQVYDRVLRREFLTVGSQQEIADQTTAKQAHYQQLTQDAERLLREFEQAYAGAARVFYKAPGQRDYDEAGWLAYVQQMGFATTKEELDRLKNDRRFATPSGHFKPEDYQKWAEESFVPGLTALFEKHREFRGRYIASLDQQAEIWADYLVYIVFSLFQDWSRRLYEQAKIDVPACVQNTPVDPTQSPNVSRPFFHARKRMLLKQVGLAAGE